PRLSEVRADLPPSLVDAIARALAIAPRDRWATAGELAEALRTAIPKVDPTWAGPPALARWMRADPPPAMTSLEARLREASGEEAGTEPGLEDVADAPRASAPPRAPRTEGLPTDPEPEP